MTVKELIVKLQNVNADCEVWTLDMTGLEYRPVDGVCIGLEEVILKLGEKR